MKIKTYRKKLFFSAQISLEAETGIDGLVVSLMNLDFSEEKTPKMLRHLTFCSPKDHDTVFKEVFENHIFMLLHNVK